MLTKSLTSGSLSYVPFPLHPLPDLFAPSATLPSPRRPSLTAAFARSVLSEIIAGHLAGSPPPPLSAKERTGFFPLDLLKQNHKAIKLGIYGACLPSASLSLSVQ